MPAGFRRHLVGKTLRNDFHCDIAEIRMLCWQASDHIDILINQRIECYWNNTINFRPLTSHIMYAKLYPQNGDRIVAIDSVTSLHPMCRPTADIKFKQQTLSWWQKCVYLIKAIIVNAFKQLLNRRDREKLFTGIPWNNNKSQQHIQIIRILQKSAYAGIKITTKISMIPIKLHTTITRSIKQS